MILIIILGGLVAMKDYIKRGIQGRWKSATDQMGDQYDPQSVNSDILYSTQVNGQSQVIVNPGSTTVDGYVMPGQWTGRTDWTNTVETKTGSTQVGN